MTSVKDIAQQWRELGYKFLGTLPQTELGGWV
jgi:hypothetical protein